MVGEDLLQIDVGQEVQAKPFENASPSLNHSANGQTLRKSKMRLSRNDHAFCIAANSRFGVNGTSRSLIPTASKIALAIAAGTGTVAKLTGAKRGDVLAVD